uniref:Uncharacterized protein n=1 Tax=Seriola dumerili TaxID=41447 RepID=A0A3B4VCC4_SERDU
MIWIVCIERNLILSYLVSVAAVVSVAAAFLLPWLSRWLPDVVDDFKFASGISLDRFADYKTGRCSQPEAVQFEPLKVPGIDEERRHGNQKLLQKILNVFIIHSGIDLTRGGQTYCCAAGLIF